MAKNNSYLAIAICILLQTCTLAQAQSGTDKFLDSTQSLSLSKPYCNEECLNYCLSFFPTSECVSTCKCQTPTYISLQSQIDSFKAMKSAQILATTTNTDTTSKDASTCEATCELKCKSELAEKKQGCITLCVNQCKASYDFQYAEKYKQAINDQKNNTTNTSTTTNTTQTTNTTNSTEGASKNTTEDSTNTTVTGDANTTDSANSTNTTEESNSTQTLSLLSKSIPAFSFAEISSTSFDEAQNTNECNPVCISDCGLKAITPDTSDVNLVSCFKQQCSCSLPNENEDYNTSIPLSKNFYKSYLANERVKALLITELEQSEGYILLQERAQQENEKYAKLIRSLDNETQQDQKSNMIWIMMTLGVLLSVGYVLFNKSRKNENCENYQKWNQEQSSEETNYYHLVQKN